MNKFITFSFWFNNEPYLKSTLIILALLFALVFAFGIIVRSFLSKNRGNPMNDVYNKLSVIFFTMSIFGFFLLWFSSEGVSYLGMRFNYLVWLIIFILWLIPLYKRYKKIPLIIRDKKKQEEFEKYLPKKKT